ncbi:MAG: hypothetical protein WCI21_05065 [Alphaproteobacteria bacterium]
MSLIRTNTVRRTSDHFEPEMSDDPHVQKRMRAQLELIDYTAFVANREAIARDVGALDVAMIQRMAVSAAHARAAWVRRAIAISDSSALPTPQLINDLAQARAAFEELTAAYDAIRRLVERGYVAFDTPAPK